ncbi:uncharacterized protein LOC114478651 [Gouania willdenowi]|uniref:uncharacterized protein LOC114478651 n=1 Tax=Gouania willdenowi TaxID=441366 RepID=UPI001054ABD3|nr:uncharacterized protein LOC114478651 [Gouania willdenowi]
MDTLPTNTTPDTSPFPVPNTHLSELIDTMTHAVQHPELYTEGQLFRLFPDLAEEMYAQRDHQRELFRDHLFVDSEASLHGQTSCQFMKVDAYQRLPVTTIVVNDTPLKFLVDTGATNSVIKISESCRLQLTPSFVFSVCANGSTSREPVSRPAYCIWPAGNTHFSHQFVVSSNCPVNLLGRDLLLKLKAVLTCTDTGIEISRPLTSAQMFLRLTDSVEESVGTLFVYNWWVNFDNACKLSAWATHHLPQHLTLKKPEYSHCTAHVSPHPDHYFAEDFYGDPQLGSSVNDNLTTDFLYFDQHHAAIAVKLTDNQLPLFDIPDSSPHISVAKAPEVQWTDLGPFVLRCRFASDWQPTPTPLKWFSPSVNANRVAVPPLAVECIRSLFAISLSTDYRLASLPALQPVEISPLLRQVTPELWAKHKYDVGFIKDCAPVVITPKSSYRPHRKQYPLRRDALEGIQPVFDSLLKEKVIVPCSDSPVLTPIFPVMKIRPEGQPTEWRFVQDLQAVNSAIIPPAPLVPNPHTILSLIPSSAKFFTVVDLANAFFSVPVHSDSQFWFAFMFKGRQYTWTRLPQGLTCSPHIYCSALEQSLCSLALSQGSSLLQYVDDILLAAPSKEQCERDTLSLLRHLHEQGHKASLTKLQFVQEVVQFIGHSISSEGKTLSRKRVASIVALPKPLTKKQMLSFLGMCSFCRNFIPDFSGYECHLRAVVKDSPPKALVWTPEALRAFEDLKTVLQTSPTLGIPDLQRPFTLFVDEKGGCMTSVLCQKHGDNLKPCGYFSKKLDPVARAFPPCLRSVAACEAAVSSVREITGYAPLHLHVPHCVTSILRDMQTSHVSAARWLKYNTTLLGLPDVHVHRCSTLNPATLLPLPEDGEPHSCIAALSEVLVPRPDLSSVPLTNPDFIFYVDGSASRHPDTGSNKVGYAVVSDSATVSSSSLPSHYSAQAAELCALTEACRLATGRSATIYTDSRYAFGVVHDFGALWKQRGFLKSDGSPILNSTLVSALLDAIQLPSSVSVCKCAAHSSAIDDVSRGNARADAAAKFAARTGVPSSSSYLSTPQPVASLSELSAFVTPTDRRRWQASDCHQVQSSSGAPIDHDREPP